MPLHHQWILHRLEELKAAQKEAIDSYRFNEVALGYRFWWNEFCDWYLELIKPDMQAGGERKEVAQYVLLTVLRESLLTSSAYAFVTAEIWQALPQDSAW